MEKVLILDFGGQYNQLIARRVRECNVYCEVHPYTMPVEAIKAYSPIGIIFTGGPGSVYEVDSPQIDPLSLSWASLCSAFATAASSLLTIWVVR